MLAFCLLFARVFASSSPASSLDRVTVELKPGDYRPPGTLLLNMLIKDEAAHLARTLPKWAKVIDYWIIGVDDANTDDSPAVIKKHLGHLPGEIVIVHFDGMGPTWTQLVQVGIEKYPNATHGILADADFMPMVDYLDRRELDVRCSKHMYTIWTQDHKNERKMDWIYRNIPGARVLRRTHQILEVPELPEQEVFQTLIKLPLEEREGGYQDRTGKKNQRYIGFLEADLQDYPNDTRTLYYLGYAHFDMFSKNKDKPSKQDWNNLAEGVRYFKWRATLPGGNQEELWFTLLKLGEIYERFYNDWGEGERFYLNCTTLDPERADAWFYVGQHYRLRNEIAPALPYLHKAATLTTPERSLFQWHHLYLCLAKLEYGKALAAHPTATEAELREGLELMNAAKCAQSGDSVAASEIKSLRDVFDGKLTQLEGAASDTRPLLISKLLKFLAKKMPVLEKKLHGVRGAAQGGGGEEEEEEEPRTVLDILIEKMLVMLDYGKRCSGGNASPECTTCRGYRQATTPYLRAMKQNAGALTQFSQTNPKIYERWNLLTSRVRAPCR